MSDSPLQGLRVLDLTRLLPGPYASLVLGNLGAEVIKVEEPGQGDPLRYLPLPDPRCTLFGMANGGKKSITLNLKVEQGRTILFDLARRADALLEGFRPGVMERLGLGYESLAEVNPGLVYASLSGYGQTGPYRLRAGHDLNYIALAGLLGITGAPDGPPVVPGVPVADLSAALWTALGIVATLLGRQHTGRGQYLDISLLESVTSLLTVPVAEWLRTGTLPQRGKMLLSGQLACYNVYQTADGDYMTLAALEPQFWQAFCAAVGRPEWVARQYDGDQDSLISELAALFRVQSSDYWTTLFTTHDCCCEPSLTLDEAFNHVQVVERGLLRNGQLAMPVGPRGVPHPRAPELGEHTVELLSELGYSAEDVQRLRVQGVV